MDHVRALRAIDDHDATASVLWMQQAAEKGLKGWLIGQGWSLVKTHDLERLANECLVYGVDLAFFLPAGRRLRQLYLTDRYMDDSPDPEPDMTECETLLQELDRLLEILFPGA